MFIHPRSDLGIPEPPNTREKLWQETVLLAHYTGVGYPVTSRYRSADPVECKRDAQSVANFGAQSARTWEYSYMITLDGSIWEQGGEFVAAHCKNFNNKSGAVLFVNAIGVPLTDAQIASWWWLRDQMVSKVILASSHVAAPHYRYRSTGCPGSHIAEAPGAKWDSPTGEGQLGNLDSRLINRPTDPAPTPPPSTTQENTDMIKIDLNPGTPQWVSMVIGATTITHTVDGYHAGVLAKAGIPEVTVNERDMEGILRSLRATNASPFAPGKASANAALDAMWQAAQLSTS
jgi:hypothetical protein